MAVGARPVGERALPGRALFAVVYLTALASVYFSLGVVAKHALGATPFVLLAAGLFFLLTAMTYIEAASLHREPGGSTNFSRYAFNELVSFVAGWAIALDYVILVAVCALAATHYLATFWGPLGRGAVEVILALALVAFAAAANIRGIGFRQLRGRLLIAVADLSVQVVLIVLGILLVLHPGRVADSIDLGTAPKWMDVVFALTVSVIAFSGVEAAAGLAGEVRTSARGLKRLAGPGALGIVAIYVGLAWVGISALPVHGGQTALGGRYESAPVVGIAAGLRHGVLGDVLKYVVAAVATIVLGAAANSAMLGVSRVALSLATNRQIPTVVARLSPQRGSPVIVIAVASLLAGALVIPTDLEFLVGIYAFGAMLAFTIAHASVIALRFREPDRPRPFRIPLSVAVGRGSLPLPAVAGGLISLAGWISVLVVHRGSRYLGLGWMLGGLLLYVIYRTTQGTSLFERVTVPERALRADPDDVEGAEFGSILVPIFGSELDIDIVQTAGRLAGNDDDDEDGDGQGAVIEALWVFEMPLALPLEARLPDAQLQRARRALARAKAVGEEYEGVEVATATVRARRAGQAIVDEARRRGVEAIVLAAEPPSRIRGGALLGGAGGPLDDFVGDVTKYVLRKAPCRVILTAPSAEPPMELPTSATEPAPEAAPADADQGVSARFDPPVER